MRVLALALTLVLALALALVLVLALALAMWGLSARVWHAVADCEHRLRGEVHRVYESG